jgi:16S rRNA (uracil1498-N3)-methyltransferase
MKRPPRFMVERGSLSAGVARICGAELHHLRDVMRLKAGAAVTLLDEADVLYWGRITKVLPDYALVELAPAVKAAPPNPLVLAVGVIKGPRMDFLVEKAAELGATGLVPLITERSVVAAPGPERCERWRRLATAAAKQSLAGIRMAIRAPQTVAEVIDDVPKETLAVVCCAEGVPLASIVRAHGLCPITLACGPEGGFSDTELAAVVAAGWHPASLGGQRLRTETAALAALSIALGARDEIAGSD